MLNSGNLQLTLLDNDNINKWSKMPYWEPDEAICLSMGCLNENSSVPILSDSLLSQYKASGIEIDKINVENMLWKEFVNRNVMLARSVNEGSAPKNMVKSINDKNAESLILINPAIFCIWAKSSFPSFPEKLYEEVIRFCNGSKKSNIDKNNVGNPGSEARWAEKNKIIATAEKYVKKALRDGCEYCDHVQLAEYMHENGTDDKGNYLFDYPHLDESTLEKWLREGAKKALKEYPSRIVGNKGYKKSEGLCEIHSVTR